MAPTSKFCRYGLPNPWTMPGSVDQDEERHPAILTRPGLQSCRAALVVLTLAQAQRCPPVWGRPAGLAGVDFAGQRSQGPWVRRWCLRAGLAATAFVIASAMVAIVASAATASDKPTVLRFKTDAFAESAFGRCDFLYPPGPLTCHETDVQVVKEGVGGVPGGTVAPPKTPWAIFIDDYTLSFTSGGPDAVPVLSDQRTGFLLDPTVTFDQQHLSYLTVDAQVLMSDEAHSTSRVTGRLSLAGRCLGTTARPWGSSGRCGTTWIAATPPIFRRTRSTCLPRWPAPSMAHPWGRTPTSSDSTSSPTTTSSISP